MFNRERKRRISIYSKTLKWLIGSITFILTLISIMIPANPAEAADVRIFIDPGHGGSDTGTTANGLQEKDVTLDIASKTKDILNEEYSGNTIKLSRTSDATVPLDKRTDMANDWGANLFVSIHINSGNGSGYESYTFDSDYNDRERTNAIRKSIHDEVAKQTGFTDRGKKEENFHVLRESNSPAILTENGFIDSAEDASNLNEDAFIDKIAQGHADGIAKALGLSEK